MLTKTMKKISTFAMTLVSIMFFLVLTTGAIAEENTLDSGYYATTNYGDDPIPSGEPVTVTAQTINPKVFFIVFRWYAPDGELARLRIRLVKSDGETWTNTSGTYIIYFAEDTYTPGIPGHWRIEVVFWGINYDFIYCFCLRRFAVRKTSFNVVPEIPVLGSVGSATAMFASFFIYKKKKKWPHF